VSELNEVQLNQVKPPARRSLSQLKQGHQQQFSNFTKPLHKSSTKPIQKLFDYLKIFKVIFHIIQRDLVVRIFQYKIPHSETLEAGGPLFAQRPKSRSMNDIYTYSERTEETTACRNKMIQKVKKYHEILYELNEKLMQLINDRKESDVKLMSPHSGLQAKYLYYKQGEYVLRLTTDIICKFQMILNICQTVIYLHSKLTDNDFSGFSIYSKLEDYSEDFEYDREFNYYSCPKNELKKQYAVLKLIPRKKMPAFQKLPKIMNETAISSKFIDF